MSLMVGDTVRILKDIEEDMNVLGAVCMGHFTIEKHTLGRVIFVDKHKKYSFVHIKFEFPVAGGLRMDMEAYLRDNYVEKVEG